MLQFLRTRQWIMARRLVLVAIVLFVAYRNYGDSIVSALSSPNAKRDITITRQEFRTDVPGEKPVWIIGLHNQSRKFTYDQVQLDAAYYDDAGKLLERDKLVVRQRLGPGEEQIVGSSDFKSRGPAKRGSLAVLDAQRVK